MSKEGSNVSHSLGNRKVRCQFNICFVNFYSFLRGYMAQDNSRSDYEMTLLSQNKMFFLIPSKHFLQMVETFIKGFSKNCKIIHEYLQELLHHVNKNAHHAYLKNGWHITQAKGHTLICIGAKMTCESSFILVLKRYFNLVIP